MGVLTKVLGLNFGCLFSEISLHLETKIRLPGELINASEYLKAPCFVFDSNTSMTSSYTGITQYFHHTGVLQVHVLEYNTALWWINLSVTYS